MENAVDSIIYGISSSNKIECWWRDLHERFRCYFKEHLTYLLQRRDYDPHNAHHRQLTAYVFIPVIQKECNIFVNNASYSNRCARAHVFVPWTIWEHTLWHFDSSGAYKKIREAFGLLDSVEQENNMRLKDECERLFSYPGDLEPHKVTELYLYLKQGLRSELVILVCILPLPRKPEVTLNNLSKYCIFSLGIQWAELRYIFKSF